MDCDWLAKVKSFDDSGLCATLQVGREIFRISLSTFPGCWRFPAMNTQPHATGRDLAAIIRDHQAMVWRYLRVLGCSEPLADDLTQETFLAVLQRPFEDRDRNATAAYLRKAARSLFISWRRRNARYVPGELDEAEAAWQRWAATDEGEGLMEALELCRQKLTERAQRALELRYRHRHSRSEIAQALKLSEHGAKNLLQRAKQQLRACIERRLP